jgi:hypothetical protein
MLSEMLIRQTAGPAEPPCHSQKVQDLPQTPNFLSHLKKYEWDTF